MKKLNIFLFVFGMASLATGNLVNFMILFAMAGLTQKGVAMVSLFPCSLDAISEPDDCNTRGGLSSAYWVKASDIDWNAMESDPTSFDPTEQKILGYIMVGAAVFTPIKFNRKGGSYSFTWTDETQSYEQLIPMIFEGKDSANRVAIQNAISCCKIILHLFDNNGLERVVGIEWNGSKFVPQVRNLRVVRHLDASGNLSGEKGREELDLGGESTFAPLYAEVGEANMPV